MQEGRGGPKKIPTDEGLAEVTVHGFFKPVVFLAIGTGLVGCIRCMIAGESSQGLQYPMYDERDNFNDTGKPGKTGAS